MKMLTSCGDTWKVGKTVHNLVEVAERSLATSALHSGKGGHGQ